MKSSTKYYLTLLGMVAVYFGTSKLLFDKIYGSLPIVIDELFHIPQGIQYCNHNFTYWDPKITTLPGLYLISSAFLGPYFSCTQYNLRFINLIASCVNLTLFSSILKFVYGNTSSLKTVLQALNLTLLPPLYFFSHVYYTDTLSLMFLLAFFRLCLVNRYKLLSLIFALGSVMMRQTNIVWIGMVFGHKVVEIFIKSSRVFGNQFLSKTTLNRQSLIAKDVDASKLKRYYSLSDFFLALTYHITTCATTFFKFLTIPDVLILLTDCVTIVLFLIFVYINGSIVVGDKKAHEASLHIPQLFYFLIFYGIFALPYILAKLDTTLKLIFNNKFKVFIYTIIFLIVVHYNTIVHPYLLADNRHYTFYIWNRWYGKYYYAKYVTVPAYIVLLFSLYDNLKQQNCISFLLPFTLCTFVGLCLQKMIEVRYFLVPFIILRLRFIRPSFKLVLFEFVWYLVINVGTFYVFFNKEILWSDFDYAQKIIW